MKSLLTILALFCTLTLSAQLRTHYTAVVNANSFTGPTQDSLFTGTLSSFYDQFSLSYTPLQIAEGFMLLDASGRLFRVKSVSSPTFSSVSVVVAEQANQNLAPSGTSVIYQPIPGTDLIPPPPSNTLGISSVLLARIQVHNAKVTVDREYLDSVVSTIVIPPDTLAGDSTLTFPTEQCIVVYAPSHGLTIPAKGYIAVDEDYDSAGVKAPIGYAISTPDPDSLCLVFGGEYIQPSHGLSNGMYYLQTDGSESQTPDNPEIRTVFVINDSTYIFTEQGAQLTNTIPRVPIPGVYITAFGGDPVAPSDSVIQEVAEFYASNGRIRAGSVLVTQYASNNRNPAHVAANTEPSFPSHVWLWNGQVVTRVESAPFAINMQDTLYGGLGTLELTPVASTPSDSLAADWLKTNVENNGLFMPNGSYMYYVGSGTVQNPDYIWTIATDVNYLSGIPNGNYGQIIKRIKNPSAVGATTLYSGNGTISSNRTATIGSGNTLTFTTPTGAKFRNRVDHSAASYNIIRSMLDTSYINIGGGIIVPSIVERNVSLLGFSSPASPDTTFRATLSAARVGSSFITASATEDSTALTGELGVQTTSRDVRIGIESITAANVNNNYAKVGNRFFYRRAYASQLPTGSNFYYFLDFPTDTSATQLTLWNGKYGLPNATPASDGTPKILQWLNGTPSFVNIPSGGSGGGIGNSADTISKTSHGFAVFTPIFWDGDSWETIVGTADTISSDRVVVEVIDANTFVAATGGEWPTVVADGYYWKAHSGTGYSTTQDTINQAVFNVKDGVAHIYPPLTLTSGATGGGAADGNGIISALPTSDVAIDALQNEFLISNLQSVTFSQANGDTIATIGTVGSGEDRAYLNSTDNATFDHIISADPDGITLESPFPVRIGAVSDFLSFPTSRPAQNSFMVVGTDGSITYKDTSTIGGGASDGNGIYSGSGSLIGNTTVSNNGFDMTFSATGIGNSALRAIADTAAAIIATSTTQAAVQGTSTSSYGLYGSSTSGNAVFGLSNTGYGGDFWVNGSTASGDVNVARFVRNYSGGTPSNNIAGTLRFDTELSTGGSGEVAAITWVTTDVTSGSLNSKLEFETMLDNSIAPRLTIFDDGALNFSRYGDGNETSGTATYGLGVDASGNVMEVPLGGSGTTNLGHNLTGTTVEITSSSGTSTTIPQATTTNAGVLAAVDKVIIDNAVVTTGSYANPSWITSLDWATKITGKPTTLSGYGITDAVTGSGVDGQFAYWTGASTLSSTDKFTVDYANGIFSISRPTVSTSGTARITLNLESVFPSNNTASGFGTGIDFYNEDANTPSTVVGRISSSRATADNVFSMQIKAGLSATVPFTFQYDGKFGVNTDAPAYTGDFNGTDAIRTAVGTTAQRPTGAAGLFRFNTTWTGYDAHNGTAWRRFLTLPDATPTTGAVAIYNGTAWESKQLLSASVSTTVDASGDVTVTHGNTDATFQASIQVTGTTLRHTVVHTKDATTFKVRFFDSTGTVLANGTSVDFDWIVKDN